MTGRVDQAGEQPDEFVVETTAVAHGGHMIARHDGRVIFVRHALPQERVRVRITERTKSFWRADVVDVLEAAPDRVSAPCAVAGVCGGCDFQHVSPAGQLRLLASVVSEQLQRIAQEEWPIEVEPIGDFLGWRTRMDWALTPAGDPGLRRHRSHDIVARPDCLIAHEDLPELSGTWAGDQVKTVITSTGQRFIATDSPEGGLGRVDVDGLLDRRGTAVRGIGVARESVFGREFHLAPTCFWQVHPKAAETLVAAVLDFAEVQAGETALDLYAGVGLFSRFLAEEVGASGQIHSVEGNRTAHQFAATNLAEFAQVVTHHGPVEKVLQRARFPKTADVIVADPPRSGAKPAIVHIAERSASRIVHIGCDPAAFARDVTLYRNRGYRLTKLRAFALFPMTHHVECVAVFEPSNHGRS